MRLFSLKKFTYIAGWQGSGIFFNMLCIFLLIKTLKRGKGFGIRKVVPLDVVFSGHGTQAACRKKSQSAELLFDPIAFHEDLNLNKLL